MSIVETKICKKCKENKSIGCFYKERVNSCKFRPKCKKCMNGEQTEREKSVARKREMGELSVIVGVKVCSECKKEKETTQFSKDNSSICGIRSKCKQCNKKYALLWKENKSYIDNRNKRLKERYYTDENFRLKMNISSRVNLAIGNKNKSGRTEELLGCTIDELKKHLESKFTKGMSWETRGKFGWNIDHIRPCSSFDLSKEEQQKECFHYTNLQPLWATTKIAMSYGEDEFYVGNIEKSNNI